MEGRWNPAGIVILYNEVLRYEITMNVMYEYEIQQGLREITLAHHPRNHNFLSSKTALVDYNRKALRCAYLHRFASLYTGLSYEMLSSALRQNQILCNILYPKINSSIFHLCALGGGPGTDVVGVWSALYHFFDIFQGIATVVDKMFGWEDTVNSVISELQTGRYPVSVAFDPDWFDCRFLTADLLGDIPPRVQKNIGQADMVTMFKFLSAAACEDTEKMLENIFDIMKPGALVFFINNASGGFRQLVARVAIRKKFITIFGPLNHVAYENAVFNVIRFGCDSLWKTTVTVEILKKPDLGEI